MKKPSVELSVEMGHQLITLTAYALMFLTVEQNNLPTFLCILVSIHTMQWIILQYIILIYTFITNLEKVEYFYLWN